MPSTICSSNIAVDYSSDPLWYGVEFKKEWNIYKTMDAGVDDEILII